MGDTRNIRKLLTIDDLVKFCSEQNFTKFSSRETGYKLSVQVPATFEVDDEVDNDHRGMMKLKFRIFHTGLNRNGSFVSEDAAKSAMPTIKNRPILAHIHQLDNGDWDFESHNMEIVTNEDGEEELVYIEKQVGSFSEEEPFFEYDEDLDKTYICAYGYIPEDYTKAASIIRAKNGTKNSCELSIDELSYNAKEHYLDLQAFYVMGSTLLGSKKDGTEIGEGMLGSRADIVDFSEQNNSMFSKNDKLVEVLEKLNNTLSNFHIDNNQRKEETEVDKEIFEQVTEEVVETTEEVVETTEEVFEEVEEVVETTEEITEENAEENVEESVEEVVEETTEESTEEVIVTEEESEETTEETPEVVVEEETVEAEEEQFEAKFVKTFELSHDDIRYALYNLLIPYEESDNEYYWIMEVFDSHFVYQGYSGKVYGQKYAKDGDNVLFDGERYELFLEYLTESEKTALAEMRSNYASLVQFKEDTENAQLHAQRESILYNEKYSVLAEKGEDNEYKNEAFAKLVSEMDNYSLTDLEKELKSVFADYITNGGQFAYAGEPEVKPVVSKKAFAASTEKKTSRYGNLFSK